MKIKYSFKGRKVDTNNLQLLKNKKFLDCNLIVDKNKNEHIRVQKLVMSEMSASLKELLETEVDIRFTASHSDAAVMALVDLFFLDKVE